MKVGSARIKVFAGAPGDVETAFQTWVADFAGKLDRIQMDPLLTGDDAGIVLIVFYTE